MQIIACFYADHADSSNSMAVPCSCSLPSPQYVDAESAVESVELASLNGDAQPFEWYLSTANYIEVIQDPNKVIIKYKQSANRAIFNRATTFHNVHLSFNHFL